MHCSVAKFMVDAEQCAMGYRMAEGVRWDDFDEALAAVRDIGPGGHYLGHAHTQQFLGVIQLNNGKRKEASKSPSVD